MFDPKTKILIVDDMAPMRELMKEILGELGFTDISEAENGNQAWERITSSGSSYELVISDWNMPNGTGIDLLKRIRNETRTQLIPFIMLTGETEKEQIIEAGKAGVTEYIIKPFSPQTVKEKLELAYQLQPHSEASKD